MTLKKDTKNNLEYFDAVVDGYKNFDKNDNHYLTSGIKFVDQCCICGKGIKSYDKAFVTRGYMSPLSLVNKKDHARLEKEFQGSDMGCYYLGSECGKQVKKQLIDAGLDWKEYLSI